MAFNASPNYPGSYLGVRAPNPPNVVYNSRIPTTSDWQNFRVGDIWVYTPAVGAPVGIRVFMLISVARNSGTWDEIASGGGGIPTSTVIVTGSMGLSPNTQYIVQAGSPVNLLLPATSLVGDMIRIVGDSNLWTITQAAGQQISFCGFDTTLGASGSLASLTGSDCVELLCVDADLRWDVFTSVGNLNVI